MTNFAIAGIQMDAIHGDNLAKMSLEIEVTMLRFPWVELIMFGELCAFGSNLQSAQPMPGPAEEHFQMLARKHGIWLIPGSLYEIKNGKIYNTSPVIDPEGNVVARHRKIYPFLPYEQGVEGGLEHTIFDIPDVGRFGVSICYDSWFPETSRALAYLGAEVILHPTLTNTIDRDFELSIGRATAGTNQLYFVDVNNTGQLGYGKSAIFSPEGDVMHLAGRGSETIPVTLDLELVRRTREEGLKNLGQPLKSFRDSNISFPQYDGNKDSAPLTGLGPLAPKVNRSTIKPSKPRTRIG
jgi:deaminated glutathione amidase